MLYMYMSMEEVQPYFEMFDKTYWKQSRQSTLKQLDSMRQLGVKGGLRGKVERATFDPPPRHARARPLTCLR
jgi:hypothetical protein